MSTPKGGLYLPTEIDKNSVVHTNLKQDIIITTEDKLKLALIEHQKIIKVKLDWIPAVSIFLTVLTSLSAAEYRNFLSLTASVWHAFFLIVLIGSGIWSIITIIRAVYHWNSKESDVLNVIKAQSKEIQNSE